MSRTNIETNGTLDFVNANWGRILNSNNATQTHSIFVKFRKIPFQTCQRYEHGQFLHCQCPRTKLGKFRILPYSEIVVRGQKLQFQVICQKLSVSEQLNDQLLVNSK